MPGAVVVGVELGPGNDTPACWCPVAPSPRAWSSVAHVMQDRAGDPEHTARIILGFQMTSPTSAAASGAPATHTLCLMALVW